MSNRHLCVVIDKKIQFIYNIYNCIDLIMQKILQGKEEDPFFLPLASTSTKQGSRKIFLSDFSLSTVFTYNWNLRETKVIRIFTCKGCVTLKSTGQHLGKIYSFNFGQLAFRGREKNQQITRPTLRNNNF